MKILPFTHIFNETDLAFTTVSYASRTPTKFSRRHQSVHDLQIFKLGKNGYAASIEEASIGKRAFDRIFSVRTFKRLT